METTLDFLRAYTPARVSQVLAASPIGKGIGRTFNSTNHRARNTHESDVESDEDDDENALCAYGDVSLADAYEIPGTPSTRKPRLKPRREKPLPPSSSGRARRHRDTDVKPTSSGSGSILQDRLLNYLRTEPPPSTSSTSPSPTDAEAEFRSLVDRLRSERGRGGTTDSSKVIRSTGSRRGAGGVESNHEFGGRATGSEPFASGEKLRRRIGLAKREDAPSRRS